MALALRPGYRALLQAFGTTVAFGMMLQPAIAADAPVQKIQVTGTSIKRSASSEGALPVQVVTRDEIARSGARSTEELLQSLSAFSTQGATVNATGAGSSTYGLSTVSLRGLGEDRTLVLVNGRRLAPFAGGGGAAINVNAIPLAAVERVEVLKDGASGVYGSDAIAGVVNFILKTDFQGVDVTGSYGKPTRDGGGDNGKLAITAGFGDLASQRFNVTVGASYEKEKTLRASDREFSKSGNNPPYYTNGATGQGNIEGAWTEGVGRDPVLWGNSPGTGYGNPLALTGNCAQISMFEAGTSTKGGPYCAFDSAPFVGLIPERELINFTANATFRLNDSHEFFGDALYSQSKVQQSFQANPIRKTFLDTDSLFAEQGVDGALLLRPTNPNYQIAADYLNAQGFGALVGRTLAVTSRTLGFGGRANEDKATQYRVTAGWRGTFGSTEVELAASTNRSETEGRVTGGYFSQVQYVKIINDANNWNPWAADGLGNDQLKQALGASAYTGGTLSAVAKSNVFDAKVSGEWFKLGGGNALYAVGAQMRKEVYTTQPSAALGTGDIAGLGGSVPPVDQSRRVNALYGEMVFPFMKELEGTLAVRNDNYSDVGSSTNYKASFRYQPLKQVLFRGSVGTGFRAPTLTDLWQPQTLGNSEQFDDPATGQTDLQVNSLTGGNPDLKPEKSEQLTLGVVFSPTPTFTAGIDYFAITVKDIISSPSAQEVVSGYRRGDPAFANKVTVDANGDIESIVQTTTNTGKAEVSGFDIDANYRLRLDGSRIDLGFTGTYMLQYDQTTPSGTKDTKVATTVKEDGSPVIGADGGGVILRWKHVLSATWTYGSWSVGLAQNYYSGYEDGNDLNGNRHEVPGQSIYDANLSYRGIKGLTLGLGVKNLLDEDPPVYIPVSNQFQYGYDISLYDPRARFVYLNATYRF